MPTSQSEEITIEVAVFGQWTVMPVDIYTAAIKGDAAFLVRRLGLLEEERNDPNVRAELQSTTHLGDTILHLLVTKTSKNEIAKMIFRKEAFLLKGGNKKSETPLHVAAEAGNDEVIKNLIQIDSGMVKDTLMAEHNNGDTALHTAAKHGQKKVVSELMNFDPQVAYLVNKETLSPLHIAISEGYTDMVQDRTNL